MTDAQPQAPARRRAPSTAAEVEWKLRPSPLLGADTVSRVLVRHAGVEVHARAPIVLRAEYFDTDDLALARRGATLRRRSGGSDEGWHLKLPAARKRVDEVAAPYRRTEIVLPLDGGSEPPSELTHLVTAWTHGRPLHRIALLTTMRRPSGLVVGEDEDVAEWVRDEVAVHGPDPDTWSQPPRLTFEEWEVEAAAGHERHSAEIVHVLRALGAEPSRTASKLRTALGLDDAAAGASSVAPTDAAPATATSMRAALSRYLVTAAEAFARADQAVRLGVPDSVHQMRVQARRVRSALRTCAPMLDTSAVKDVRRTLGEAADLLGGERDLEVAAARIAAELARMCGDPSLTVDDVVLSTVDLTAANRAQAIDADAARAALDTLRPAISRRQRQAHRTLLAAMDEPWWADLHASLQRLAADPPTTSAALAPATEALPVLVRTQWHDLARRARGLKPGSSADAWHRTRLAAKRARYAADLAAPLVGGRSREFARRLADVTELLGELQDTVLVRALLDEATDPASSLGRPVAGTDDARAAFVLGRLYAEEADRERRLRERFHDVWDALDRRRLTKWMKA